MAFHAPEQTLQTFSAPSPLGVRRTSVACVFCRARKIKCIRVDHRACTNCAFESVQCVLPPKNRRSRNARRSVRPPQADPGENMPDVSNPLPQSSSRGSDFQPPQDWWETMTIPEINTGHDLSDDINNEANWRKAAIEAVPKRPISSSMLQQQGEATKCARTRLSFFKGPPLCVGGDDLDYLARKGALDIPDPELCDALIESYVYYIHPSYPILDLEELEEAMLGNSSPSFSLSVFQAIMFAGASWVDIRLLRGMGFLSRWAARRALYSKVRLLYDMDYEEDPVCQLQTLLLLSLWWQGPDEAKDGWHWLGLAISLARTMGLHQDPDSRHANARSRCLRRRLWWSCVIRDTFASFSSNRVPRISDTDFTTKPLTLQDFEWKRARDDTPRGIGMQGLNVQKQLANICIQTAAICRIITRMLLAGHRRSSSEDVAILWGECVADAKTHSVRLTMPPGLDEAFQACQPSWLSSIAPRKIVVPPSSQLEQAQLVHESFLSILYYAGFILLYRQQRDTNFPSGNDSRSRVRDAAGRINEIVMNMYAANLMKDMPPTVISLLLLVSVCHLMDTKSQEFPLRERAFQRLEECKQALRELFDGHLAAEWAINLLNYAESNVNALVHGNPRPSTPINLNADTGLPSVHSHDILRHVHGDEACWTPRQDLSDLAQNSDYASMSHTQPTQLTFGTDFVDWTGSENAYVEVSPDIPLAHLGADWSLAGVDDIESSVRPINGKDVEYQDSRV